MRHFPNFLEISQNKIPEKLKFPDIPRFPQLLAEILLDSYSLRLQNGAPFASVSQYNSSGMALRFYYMQNDKESEKILLEVDISGHCNILQHTATRGVSINQLTGFPAHFIHHRDIRAGSSQCT